MIYELRIYRCVPVSTAALLSRFENETLRIWEKHGIRQALDHADRQEQPRDHLHALPGTVWPSARSAGPFFLPIPNGSRWSPRPRKMDISSRTSAASC
jgi:hypothetical protein